MSKSIESKETSDASYYYDKDYFDWQKNVGAFGGWSNSFKFNKTVSKKNTVIDFGCGGGFLLKNLECQNRIGIEPNISAATCVKSFGIQHFFPLRRSE